MSGLVFRRLRIDRLLGITEGFELRDLAAGVNVIYGPNASGKTTTARALEALLWPRAAAPSGAIADAGVELGGDRWLVRLDSGHVEYQQNGVPVPGMPTAPAENRDRYRLWLADLLTADDTGFARQILIESSGGFDLERAARRLERRRPTHRQRREQVELRQARERVRALRTAAQQLSEESRTLVLKERSLARRADLEQRLRVVSMALDLAERRHELEAAEARLAQFPTVLARLRGDELDQFDDISRKVADAEGRHAAAALRVEKACRALQRLAIGPDALDGDLVHRLLEDAEALQDLDRLVTQQEILKQAATTRLNEEEAALRGVSDPARLARVAFPDIALLTRQVEAAEEANAEERAIEAELRALPASDQSDEDQERLQNGVFLLRQWLADPPASPPRDRLYQLALAGGAVAAAAGLVLLVLGSIGVAIPFLLLGLILLVATLRVPRQRSARPVREAEYIRLGLAEVPATWEIGDVDGCLRLLEGRLARARETDRVAQRRQQLTARLTELNERQERFSDEIHSLAGDIGLKLPDDAVSLLWLVERISRWQKARTEREAAERAVIAAFGARQAALEMANHRLSGSGMPTVSDVRALKGAVEKLRADIASHERIAAEAEQGREDLSRSAAEIDRLKAEATRNRTRLGIEEGEESRLAEWLGLLHGFAAARSDCDSLRAHCARVQSQLDAEDGADAAQPVDTGLLRNRKVALERELAGLEAVALEVGSLRERIEIARGAHALEDALEEEARCADALRELRDRELRAGVAAILVDWVERATRRDHLPQVFHRANELFGLITRYAYELRVASADNGAFRAYDTRTERSHSLEELSSGTRVQLLLAVRLAFVEALEGGIALPLLMDETLANSDDERAAAIMDAVIRLSSEGRQVFYFTAQPDEVLKWQRVLARHPGVPHQLIDLGEIRQQGNRIPAETLQAITEEHLQEHTTAPDLPRTLKHSQFPEWLSIPSADPLSPVSSLHLWYLLEDAKLLRFVLVDLKMSSWGELSSLIRAGGKELLPTTTVEKLRATATLAESTLHKLQVGAGRKVDRAALAASGAVTPRFMDELDDLAKRCEGSAAAIVAALDARQVPSFLRRNVDLLRQYFEDEGYLDQRKQIPATRVRQQLVAEHASLFATGAVSLPELDRLIARLVAGSSPRLSERRATAIEQPQLWGEAEA